MTKKEIIQLILLGLLVIGVVILVTAIFRRPVAVPDIKGEMKAKDEVIEAIIRERDTYRAWKDEAIAQRNTADSLLQIKYKSNTKVYERIPIIVNAMPTDELVSAAENFR